MTRRISEGIPKPDILLDTTLRDGEQAPGVALTPDEKAQYVQLAEEAGIRYIEVGFPESPLDLNACRAAVAASRHSRLVAMSLVTTTGVQLVSDIGVHEILFVVPCSSNHLKHVLGKESEALMTHLLECIDLAARKGLAVNIGLEDASQLDMQVINYILQGLASVSEKIDCITIPDTRGQLLPTEVEWLLLNVRHQLPSQNCRLAYHAHNDLGLATANSLAALQMTPPVDCIHVTCCGFGERAGNASLEQMAVLINKKLKRPSSINLSKLRELAEYTQEVFLTPVHAHSPIIGAKVFLHESGLHQKGMLNDGSAYQYLDPIEFGRHYEMILGKHSGKRLRHLIAKEAECEDQKVWEMQKALTNYEKSPAKATVRISLKEIDRVSFMGIKKDDAINHLKAAQHSQKQNKQ